MATNSIRNSNIELLRIVSMLMIMTHHFIIHALYPEVMTGAPAAVVWLNAICYVAVNCFVLISGYFSIRLSWRRIVSWTFIVVFYALVTNITERYLGGGRPGKTLLWYSLFPFAHNASWWFVTQYTILMLVSPLLNAALKSLDNRSATVALMAVLVADVYIGWWGQQDNGYSIFHFITLYVVGSMLHRNEQSLWAQPWLRRAPRLWSLAIWLGCATLWSILLLWKGMPTVLYRSAVSYNNPLVLLGAVALFCFFLRLNFKSRAVNYIAQSAIAAYLLQDGIPSLYDCFADRFAQPTVAGNIAVILCGAVAFFAFGIAVDQIRLVLWRTASRLLTRWAPQLMNGAPMAETHQTINN